MYTGTTTSVLTVSVEEGDAVAAGQVILVLASRTVTAPYGGIVTRLPFRRGDEVPAGSLVAQVVGNDVLVAVADATAEEASRVKPGDKADMRPLGASAPIRTTVERVVPPARGADGRFGSARLFVAVPKSSPLLPGMDVDITVRITRTTLYVTVPVEAVHEEPADVPADPQFLPFSPVTGETRKYVFALVGQVSGGGLVFVGPNERPRRSARDVTYTARKIYVTIGRSDSRRIEILDGIDAFVPVIVASDRKILDYDRVIVVDRDLSTMNPIVE
jgi:multidrug efflux pump subunit AcrA (membrane-fusion protein)